ncbi:MAG: response regulator [Planctomycetota bacterium]
MKRKEVLTTGEVAKVCNVAPRTVSKWFDTGKLRGYRIPGSRDRRIPVSQLVKFMRAHGMPLNGLDGGALRVLVVDDDADALEMVVDMLATRGNYEIQPAVNGFEAGMLAERFNPHVILLDLMLGDVDGRDVCKNIKHNPALAATKVVAVSGQLTTRQGQKLLSEGFDAYLAKPFEAADVFNIIEEASNLVH